jgi:hypothetical protein
MTKKLFALIIASSIVTLPITAQDIENTPEQKNAHDLGLKKGIVGTIAASSFAMLLYLGSSIKDGLYIPSKINCQRIFDGYEWKWTQAYCPGNQPCFGYYIRQEKYKTICDDNPLFNTLNDMSGPCSIGGAQINIENGMIQKINNFLPTTLGITCFFTFVGALWYYSNLNKEEAPIVPQPLQIESTDTEKEASTKTAAQIVEQLQTRTQ